MTTFFRNALVSLFAFGLLAHAPASLAQGKGNAEDATALVKKAVAYYKKNGREQSLAAFNDGKGQFIDRDMYIFVIDQKGKMLAHGTLPRIVDKDVLEMKDADGNFLFKDMLKVTSSKDSGWVHYKWPNPVTKQIEAKSTYLEKIDGLVIGCGIYK